MIFLGIDTATRVGSVGLVRAALDGCATPHPEPGRIADGCDVLGEVSRDTGLGHGTELLPMIDQCLEQAGTTLDDVAVIAVSIGPGSFTGLRVALATAKGLVLGGAASLVGVPTLEALATSLVSRSGGGVVDAPVGTLVAACLDARKGEVYGAAFRVREPVWRDPAPRLERMSDDAALAPARFSEALAAAGAVTRVMLLGDGAARYPEEIARPLDARATVLPLDRWPPSGAAVARVGAGRFAARGADDRAALVPRYARASEAEIMRDRRGAGPSSR
ncbi:tRNA (adenosine(37)-N6)-threonylcarbamoyltransferase complex dimerization subunit type 1 TsaB [Candidatus Binatia bacterium]|nr:tRNA (adenosine(37)-N6)-threonylcarbamoyltransferase complex dimerization subunit type 1 TsaB [Candidatus Binatia bacterium]